MPHFPKPFFKKGRGVWYVEIDRKQINLGPDRDEAFRRYHQLMTQPQARKVAADSVLGVIDAFLDWCSKHRAAHTYRWYRDRLQEFAATIDPGLTVGCLRPYHVQQWIDAREGWADGSRRNAVRAVKRVFKWAEEQGYIERSPVAHMKKPRGGKREVIVSEKEFNELLGLCRDRSFVDLLIVTWETGCRPQESLIVEGRSELFPLCAASYVDEPIAHERRGRVDGGDPCGAQRSVDVGQVLPAPVHESATPAHAGEAGGGLDLDMAQAGSGSGLPSGNIIPFWRTAARNSATLWG
jgi:hypothetical protein